MKSVKHPVFPLFILLKTIFIFIIPYPSEKIPKVWNLHIWQKSICKCLKNKVYWPPYTTSCFYEVRTYYFHFNIHKGVSRSLRVWWIERYPRIRHPNMNLAYLVYSYPCGLCLVFICHAIQSDVISVLNNLYEQIVGLGNTPFRNLESKVLAPVKTHITIEHTYYLLHHSECWKIWGSFEVAQNLKITIWNLSWPIKLYSVLTKKKNP